MVEKVLGWIRSLTEVGLALVALGVVLQIIFGGTVPFLGGDVVGTLVALIHTLGDAGLVGLIAAVLLWKLFTKDD